MGALLIWKQVGALLEQARDQLDHRMLNDVEGLGAPTLENICLWLWGYLETDLPQICAVEVSRDSLGQSCLYQGSQHGR
jgi:6-pyruvoyltetrahydropterin/6-carboxytetrahydropterin synthase